MYVVSKVSASLKWTKSSFKSFTKICFTCTTQICTVAVPSSNQKVNNFSVNPTFTLIILLLTKRLVSTIHHWNTPFDEVTHFSVCVLTNTSEGCKVCRLSWEGFWYSRETRYTFNLIFLNTNYIVSSKIHSHWTVIQEFERGNFAEAIVEKIKSKQPGLVDEKVAASSGKCSWLMGFVAMVGKSGE